MKCIIKSILLFLLLSNFIIPITARAYCAPYVAVIDSIEPNIDCLQIRATALVLRLKEFSSLIIA